MVRDNRKLADFSEARPPRDLLLPLAHSHLGQELAQWLRRTATSRKRGAVDGSDQGDGRLLDEGPRRDVGLDHVVLDPVDEAGPHRVRVEARASLAHCGKGQLGFTLDPSIEGCEHARLQRGAFSRYEDKLE